MTERERLIDLLSNARYKYALLKYEGNIIADHLLEHGVIVPPCKIGDTIYSIARGRILAEIVEGIHFDWNSLGQRTTILTNGSLWESDAFGVVLFLSREEAEKALRNDNNE